MKPLCSCRLAAVVLAAAVAFTACGRTTAPKPADDRARDTAIPPRLDDRAHDTRPGRADEAHEARPGSSGSGPVGVEVHGPPSSPASATLAARPLAPAGDRSYAGRPIAPTCSYLGADWLDRPERDQREQPDRVLDALALDPHATVADVGAGTGYFTVRLARRVAKVHATDLQPEMLELLAGRLATEHLGNVELHRATEHDAALPARCCDLILLVDVYHELSDPAAVMAGIRRALTAHGRLVLVEYRGEDPAVAIRPEHKMTLPQIQKELTALGFRFLDSLEFLPDQRVVIFE